MGATHDKSIQVNQREDPDTVKDGNISNVLCCSACSSVCAVSAVPVSQSEIFKEWGENMQSSDKTRKPKPSNRFGAPSTSTPASERVKVGASAGASAESMRPASRGPQESSRPLPASRGPQASADGPTALRSYSPSASYFIPAVTPTQGWDAEGQTQLERAVQQAASETKVRPPGYRAMQQLKLEISRGHRPPTQSMYNDRSKPPHVAPPPSLLPNLNNPPAQVLGARMQACTRKDRRRVPPQVASPPPYPSHPPHYAHAVQLP
jgi:hypothetical protein